MAQTKKSVVCPHCGIEIPAELLGEPTMKEEIAKIFERWNEFAKKHSLPLARPSGLAIARALNARLKETGFADDFAIALQHLEENTFYLGVNDRSWTATLGWLSEPGKAADLAEKQKALNARKQKEQGNAGTQSAGRLDARKRLS